MWWKSTRWISEKTQYLKQAADAIIVKNELACVDAGDEPELYSLHNIETGEIESSNFYWLYICCCFRWFIT